MSSKRAEIEAKANQVITRFKELGLFTHCYVASGRFDSTSLDLEIEHLPHNSNVFDLASLTKALATAPLLLGLLDGRLNLDLATLGDMNKLSRNPLPLPSDVLGLRISDVISHKSGLPAWTNFWVCYLGSTTSIDSRNLVLEVISRRNNWIQIPKIEVYSDIGHILIGKLMEEVCESPLSELFAREFVFDGPEWAGYGPLPTHLRAIPTGFCKVRGRMLCGEVHDENCAALGGSAGHAGLFATGRGVVSLLRQLEKSKKFKRIFTEGFGWRKGNDPSSAVFGQGRSIGHLGFTGTAFWVDPICKSFAIALTNRVVSGRISEDIKRFRKEIFSAMNELYER